MKCEIFAKKVDGSVESFGEASSITDATRKIDFLSHVHLNKKSVDLGYLYFYFLPKEDRREDCIHFRHEDGCRWCDLFSGVPCYGVCNEFRTK